MLNQILFPCQLDYYLDLVLKEAGMTIFWLRSSCIDFPQQELEAEAQNMVVFLEEKQVAL